MKQVIVTGAGGFIGSHLVETLVQTGVKVRAFIHYNSRNDPGLLRLIDPAVFNSIEFINGDLCDGDAVGAAVRGCDTVFHLGALIGIPYSYRSPLHVAQVNIMGTLNVLLAARAAGVERMIHTSTSEVYGTALRMPIDEDHPLQAQSPYSASKIGADKLAESFYCSYGLPVVIVRPFNTYGPRQSARAIIPTIISQALTSSTITLGNLETRRDFTYVSDTVRGFLNAAQAQGIEGQAVNLGVGKDYTIKEILAVILRIAAESYGRSDHTISLDATRLRPEKSEVLRLISDNRRARELMGWEPQVPLEDGLRRTIAWISQNIDLYKPGEYQV